MPRSTTERCPYCGGLITIRAKQDPDRVRATHDETCPGLQRQNRTKKERE